MSPSAISARAIAVEPHFRNPLKTGSGGPSWYDGIPQILMRFAAYPVASPCVPWRDRCANQGPIVVDQFVRLHGMIDSYREFSHRLPMGIIPNCFLYRPSELAGVER